MKPPRKIVEMKDLEILNYLFRDVYLQIEKKADATTTSTTPTPTTSKKIVAGVRLP